VKIVQLEAENVKRLRAVSIRPDPNGNLIVVGGENGAGKSAVLDSIEMAMGGAAHAPPEPVRRGEKTARVVLDLDELVVSRSWTSDGRSTLEVHAKGKGKVTSPQALLDSLFGRLSFEPLDFLRLAPKEQAETLRKIAGLDFADLDAARKAAFDERTLVNRKERELAGAVARMPAPPPGTPDTEVALKDRMTALEAARANNRKREDEIQRERGVEAQIKRALDNIAEYEGFLAGEQMELRHWEEDLALVEGRIAKIAVVDEEPLRKAVEEVEAVNARVRQKRARIAAEMELAVIRNEAAKLVGQIDAADEERARRLAGAAFPVEGLGLDTENERVTFGGLPLEQASQAEALKVSLAIGAALNPKLRVIRCRDGSLLDAKAVAFIADWAKRADMQVWLERVGDGPEVSVLIEDGAVKETR